MSESPEAIALATAARLAHALDPDGWGDSYVHAECPECGGAGQPPDPDPIAAAEGHVLPCRCEPCRGNGHRLIVPPTLAAAKAEWAAAGGDPERGPALSGRSEDGRVEWRVKVSGGGDTGLRAMLVVRIQVGSAAYVRFGNETWVPEGRAPLADWRECVRLAEAADGGAR